MLIKKWHIKVKRFIKLDFCIEFLALIDSSANINCVQKGLIPTIYFEKTYQVCEYKLEAFDGRFQNFKCSYL